MAPDAASEAGHATKHSNGQPDADAMRQLASARQNLTAHLHRKKQLDRDLISLEVSIYNFETSYLTPGPSDASSGYGGAGSGIGAGGSGGFGNIVKGYDNYLKQGGSSSSLSERKRNRNSVYGQGEVHSEDRIFSNSSSTHQRVRLFFVA